MVEGVTRVPRVGFGAGEVALAARRHCRGSGRDHPVITAAAHGASCSLCPGHVSGALPVLTLVATVILVLEVRTPRHRVVWVVQQDVLDPRFAPERLPAGSRTLTRGAVLWVCQTGSQCRSMNTGGEPLTLLGRHCANAQDFQRGFFVVAQASLRTRRKELT